MKNRFGNLGNLLLAAGLTAAGCQGHEEEKSPALLPVNVQVKLIGTAGKDSADRINYSSTIQADKSIDISSQVSGTLLSLPVEVGQYIQKGKLIATVDETVYRSQYNAQMAQVNLAKETYDRILTVYNKGSVAEIRMLSAKADYEQASAAARATYQNIAHCGIYAPQSGYIGTRNIEAGATVSPGVAIVRLFDISTVSVYVPIPETEINTYKTGLKANVQVGALPGKVFDGTIDKVSVAPSSGAPIYTVQVKIRNSGNILKPGMSCDVAFQEGHQRVRDVAPAENLIPIEALQVDEKKQYFVFVVDKAAKKAVRRNVQSGDLYENGIGITSGLQSGDELIISGFHKLTDGTSINVIN